MFEICVFAYLVVTTRMQAPGVKKKKKRPSNHKWLADWGRKGFVQANHSSRWNPFIRDKPCPCSCPLQSTITHSFISTNQPDPTLQAPAWDGVVSSSAVPQQPGADANCHSSCPRGQKNMPEDLCWHALELLLHWHPCGCWKVSARPGKRYATSVFLCVCFYFISEHLWTYWMSFLEDYLVSSTLVRAHQPPIWFIYT